VLIKEDTPNASSELHPAAPSRALGLGQAGVLIAHFSAPVRFGRRRYSSASTLPVGGRPQRQGVPPVRSRRVQPIRRASARIARSDARGLRRLRNGVWISAGAELGVAINRG